MRMMAFSDYPLRAGRVSEWRLRVADAVPSPVPPSYNQLAHLRKVAHEQARGGHPTRWSVVAVTLPAPVDLGSLERAVAAFVVRHDTLRSQFRASSGQIQRYLVPSEAVLLDRAPDVEFDRVADLRAHLIAVFARMTDPLGGPAHGYLLVRDETSATLLAAFDHVHVDPYSHTHTAAEIWELYSAALAGRAPALEPAASHLEACVAERARVTAGEGEGEGRAYRAALTRWRRFAQAGEASLPSSSRVLGLPSGEPGAGQPPALVTAEFPLLGEDVAASLETWARDNGGTMTAAVAAAFGIATCRATGQDGYRAIVALQTRADVRRPSVGWYANAAPLEFDAGLGRDFRQVLLAAQRGLLIGRRHAGIPLDLLSDDLPAAFRDCEKASWLSYIDFRALPGANLGPERDVHVLASPRSGSDVDFWVNRFSRGTVVYARFPDTAQARESVSSFVAGIARILLGAVSDQVVMA